MVYNDTTNKNGLLQRCEILCGFADGGISGNSTLKAQFTGLLNSAYHKVVTMILQSQDEWDWDDINQTLYPIFTVPMVANQRDYSFSAADKFLKIKRIDVTYDGSTYYKAEPFDINESGYGFGPAGSTMETTTDGRFSKSTPKYDIRANGIFIYPMASASDVTAGAAIRAEFFREPDEFTTSDTTQEPGIDEAFHPLLAIGASYDYCVGNDLKRAQALKNEWLEGEMNLKKYYSSKDEDRNYVLKSNYTSYR